MFSPGCGWRRQEEEIKHQEEVLREPSGEGCRGATERGVFDWKCMKSVSARKHSPSWGNYMQLKDMLGPRGMCGRGGREGWRRGEGREGKCHDHWNKAERLGAYTQHQKNSQFHPFLSFLS